MSDTPVPLDSLRAVRLSEDLGGILEEARQHLVPGNAPTPPPVACSTCRDAGFVTIAHPHRASVRVAIACPSQNCAGGSSRRWRHYTALAVEIYDHQQEALSHAKEVERLGHENRELRRQVAHLRASLGLPPGEPLPPLVDLSSVPPAPGEGSDVAEIFATSLLAEARASVALDKADRSGTFDVTCSESD